MKKVVIIFVSIILCLFIAILYIDRNNYKYNFYMINKIKENNNMDNIEYINYYNDYYTALDDKKLYLINKDYKIISEIDREKIYENKKKYDIIYNNEELLYMNDEFKDGMLIYEYYDLYTYNHIKTIKIGD